MHGAAIWGLWKVNSMQIRKDRNSKYHQPASEFAMTFSSSMPQAWTSHTVSGHEVVTDSKPGDALQLWLREQERTPDAQRVGEIPHFSPFILFSRATNPQVVMAAYSNESLQDQNSKGQDPPSAFGRAVAPRRWVKPCQFLSPSSCHLVPGTQAQLWTYMAEQSNEIPSFPGNDQRKPHGNGKCWRNYVEGEAQERHRINCL